MPEWANHSYTASCSGKVAVACPLPIAELRIQEANDQRRASLVQARPAGA
jgi:hypothetical protein